MPWAVLKNNHDLVANDDRLMTTGTGIIHHFRRRYAPRKTKNASANDSSPARAINIFNPLLITHIFKTFIFNSFRVIAIGK
jgi:hypothetical protein